MVELLVLLGILAVLLMISIPLLQGYASDRRVKSAARELMGDVAIYKERAIAENRKYMISIAGNNYTIKSCDSQGSSCSTYSDVQAKSIASFGGDIDIESAAPSDYVFLSRGIVTDSGGSVVNPGTIVLKNGRGFRATITINATGRVSVQFGT